jgi:hypothetical protein
MSDGDAKSTDTLCTWGDDYISDDCIGDDNISDGYFSEDHCIIIREEHRNGVHLGRKYQV